MVTQLRAMLLSASSAEFCVDEGLSEDPPEEVDGEPWLWGKVPAMGDEAEGVIDW